jgi:threonylcarbamoyladenosine tRNA methylthiotransferase MtaB
MRSNEPTSPTGATLRTATLGCKVNQYETELVRQALVDVGFRDAADAEMADLCLVNTCTVTGEGDAKSRQTIRRLAARNPHSRIVVMGCYATRAPQELLALPNVAEVVTDKRELPDVLRRFGVIDLPDGISRFAQRKRAYLKVQDGCLLRCSFCIIPLVRPHFASRSIESILAEARRLIDAGYRELVLCGIHLGHYGVDTSQGLPKSRWVRLPQLLARLAELEGNFRLRLSSIEATEVTRELLGVMAAYPQRICPHLHISVQSGSDAVLRRMRRRWGSRRILDRCLLAHELLDLPALTTDVIVGFPGESEGDFDQTMSLLDQAGFSKLHIFPFSPRTGTPAASFPDQVPKPITTGRADTLRTLEAQLIARYYRSLLGKPLQVLVEGQLPDGAGNFLGHACRFAPVEIGGPGPAVAEFCTARPQQALADRLLANLIEHAPNSRDFGSQPIEA